MVYVEHFKSKSVLIVESYMLYIYHIYYISSTTTNKYYFKGKSLSNEIKALNNKFLLKA